jgi:hypothetical protein
MTRKIVPSWGLKDEQGAYVTPPPPAATPPIDAEVSLDNIHQRLQMVLSRETQLLTAESAAGLLTKDQGISFERCVKVLREFKKEEREYLAALATTKETEVKDE